MEFNTAPREPAPLNDLALTGRTRAHVEQCDAPRFAAHPAALAAFLAMRESAARDGVMMEPYSAFRDFEAQVKIWNDKWLGKRALYDRDGVLLDYASLDEPSRVAAILHWSALPGASRHHWGSDIDVIDRRAVPADYRVRLLPEEFAPAGVFARLDRWIARHAADFGFFRPYAHDRGGVCPEPWHLSHAPVAVPALDAMRVELLESALAASDVLGREFVLPQLTAIHRRYVLGVDEPPESLRSTCQWPATGF
jgi:LAS superfamily LD-carboxypeptidase LdcB